MAQQGGPRVVQQHQVVAPTSTVPQNARTEHAGDHSSHAAFASATPA